MVDVLGPNLFLTNKTLADEAILDETVDRILNRIYMRSFRADIGKVFLKIHTWSHKMLRLTRIVLINLSSLIPANSIKAIPYLNHLK